MSDDQPRFRLWVRAADRRPDPEVKQTDDHTPVLLGIALWLIAFVVLLVAPLPLSDSDRTAFTVTSAVGVVLGPAGLLYFRLRHR